MRDKGWWDYYLRALVYKVPEGTWAWSCSPGGPGCLGGSRAAWCDEMTC